MFMQEGNIKKDYKDKREQSRKGKKGTWRHILWIQEEETALFRHMREVAALSSTRGNGRAQASTVGLFLVAYPTRRIFFRQVAAADSPQSPCFKDK
jgi:hypothetical protein